MEKRKKVIRMILVLLLALLICYFRPAGNVLDRIGVLGHYALPQFEGVYDYRYNYNYGSGSFWYEPMADRDIDSKSIYYDKDYLREGENISFTFRNLPITDKNRKNVKIFATKYMIPDTLKIHIMIEYNYARRTIIYDLLVFDERIPVTGESEDYYDEANIRRLMEKYSITEEDIREFQEYVLYDVVLKSWKGATFTYDLEKWKLQQCRVEDLTFKFEE